MSDRAPLPTCCGHRAHRAHGPLKLVVLASGALLAGPLVCPAAATSAWTSGGIPIATSAVDEFSPMIVADGHGGALISWVRGGDSAGVYVVAIDGNGSPRPGWAPGGALTMTGTDPHMRADGAGGAFIGSRSHDGIDYRHVPSTGAMEAGAVVPAPTGADGGRMEAAAGDPLRGIAPGTESGSGNGNTMPFVAPDGEGGAFLAYMRSEYLYDTGSLIHFLAGGGQINVSLSQISGCGDFSCSLRLPTVCSDGAGGALVAWGQGCSPRVLRFAPDLTVSPGWSAQGVPVTTACDNTYPYLGISPDGEGGAYVCWQGYPMPKSGHNLHLQRVTASGSLAPGWPDSGIVIASHPTLPGFIRPYFGYFCSIVPDGFGGVLLAWTDERADTGDVYVQRVTRDGQIAPGWTPQGVGLGVRPGFQQYPVLMPDGAGGALVAWQDEGLAPATYAIYANHVDGAGTIVPSGGAAGVLVSSGPAYRLFPRIAGDGAGGAFVAWMDYRNGNADIYAMHVTSNLTTATPPPSPGSASRFAIEAPRPNPSAGGFHVGFSLPKAGETRLELVDPAGRTVARRDLGALEAGRHAVSFALARPTPPGLYFIRLVQGSRTAVARVSIVR